jgi:hypothetical protein
VKANQAVTDLIIDVMMNGKQEISFKVRKWSFSPLSISNFFNEKLDRFTKTGSGQA